MDKKIYKNTRYQNIKQHIKNKNYVVLISKPVKTSISRINGEKIWRIEEALKIRDNPKIKMQKKYEVNNKDDFSTLYEQFLYECENIKKLGYSTIKKRKLMYEAHMKPYIKKSVTKLTEEDIVIAIDKIKSTDKQKNEVLEIYKIFFNWCIKQKIIFISPTKNIKKIKVTKEEMKYWLPEHFTKFLNYVNTTINETTELNIKETAYRTKIVVLLGFVLGDRIGETRALKWSNFDAEKSSIYIQHSINYNTKSKDYTKTTKTYSSQRKIDVTSKIIDEINKYRFFLENEMEYNINDDDLILFNYSRNRPYSDVSLRKLFYKYIELAEVPKIRLYDLRHSYVATMMTEEIPLYLISERLGHINYNTTVNKYGHLSNKIRKEVASITDKFI